MPSNRRYRQGWILVPALAFSAAFQVGGLAAYEVLRPEPKPKLRLQVDSRSELGDDAVLVSTEGGEVLRNCRTADRHCRLELDKGTRVRIDALPGIDSTFEGWDGCTPAEGGDVLRCEVVLDDSVAVTVRFGEQPKDVDVALLDEFGKPIPFDAPPEKRGPEPREEIEAEKLEDAVEVAIVPPVPPDFVAPPLPPPLPPEEKKKEQDKPQPPPPEMRMVEVPDENEVKEAPDDATHLSDKNRDVKEETRATETNLEKEMTGDEVASAPSPDQSEEIGGPEEDIAQLEESEATTDQRVETSDRSGTEESSKGAVVGEEGDAGEEGEGEKKEPGMMAMRGIEGRGSVVDQGDGKKRGKKGKEGVKTQLDFNDYERIVGKDRAEKERAIARRDQSMKKGRYKKKLQAIKSALENFTPDVRTGNQTALKTRAHPFAVYIARMHRRIHELWGFGWLEDLDGKGADHPLNDFDLFVSIEFAVNPDGTVHKMTIAKGSGELEFDVAALHTVEAGGPYDQTPEKIRSVDGRVYLRWGFYRNWRQCGTFNVEPYILTDIPGGIEPLPEGMDTRDGGDKGSKSTALEHDPERGTRTVTPDPEKGSGAAGDRSSPGSASGNAEAEYAVGMWVAGFSTASTDRMLKVSALPFHVGNEVAAENQKDLRAMYEGLIVESGALSSYKVMSTAEYAQETGSPVELPTGSLVLLIKAKETFAVVLVPTKSGEYRATMVVR